MLRRTVSFAALIAALGGIALLAAISALSPGIRGTRDPSAGAPPAEPEVVFQGMEMREIRGEGAQYRMVADRAAYRFLTGGISAAGVTLEIPGAAGNVTVRAPMATWDTRTGQVLLPEGGAAENGTGWSAAVASARLSLPDRQMTAAGAARLSGPGLSVAGSDLVWKWREGKVALQQPKTRLEPARTLRRRG
ncbi:MAG: hypothetical protein FIA93_09160 [Deltaproteobacteria bacterium]|nr:hypothetical protein [Deltaproteobacteria bacterium]PWB62169.1 MAG: hypothetical protein C3F14_10260 [Deltaproteobacteria bacterium]